MKKNKGHIIFLIVIIFLVIIATSLVIIFNMKNTKEIKVSKEFIQLLYDNNMIENKSTVNDIKYKSEKISDGTKEFYRVSANEYGIDIDSNYNVIGFSNNLSSKYTTNQNINEEEAREIAEKYIVDLVKDNYMFKEAIDPGEKQVSYYSYRFTRYKDDYPFYNDTILINIDKYTGFLSNYSNTSSQGEPKEVVINIDDITAENTALELFNSLNKNGVVDKTKEKTYRVYYDNKDKSDTELCYLVTISGLDIDNKEVQWKYFVSTETGEIINYLRDTVSNTKASGK